MKVIFLDFDGVLNCANYIAACGDAGLIIDPTRMAFLKQIVDQTGAKIVLSTSWRIYWAKEQTRSQSIGAQINEIFGRFGLEIYDKTPELHDRREKEIECWLNGHPQVQSFVVLDDMLLSAAFMEGHFVKTSYYFHGLDETDVQEAIRILNGGEKRTLFVVSDIHGHCSILKDALAKAGFDPKNEKHLLVCCGDYFDRGTENMEVLKFLERLQNKVLLRGNHEDLWLQLLQTGQVKPHHYVNGTLRALENFFGKYSMDPVTGRIDFSGKTRMVDRLCEFIGETVDYFETEDYVFVHGWLPWGAQTPEQRQKISGESWEDARKQLWIEKYNGEKPLTDKTLVCGHVPTFCAHKVDPNRDQDDCSIYYGNGLIAIDAGTADTAKINVLVLET